MVTLGFPSSKLQYVGISIIGVGKVLFSMIINWIVLHTTSFYFVIPCTEVVSKRCIMEAFYSSDCSHAFISYFSNIDYMLLSKTSKIFLPF